MFHRTSDAVVSIVSLATTFIWKNTQGHAGHVLSTATRAMAQDTPIFSELWAYGLRRKGDYDYFSEFPVTENYGAIYDLSQPSPARKYFDTVALQTIHDCLGGGSSAIDLLFV